MAAEAAVEMGITIRSARLVEGYEEMDSCAVRPLLDSSVGGACEGDSC